MPLQHMPLAHVFLLTYAVALEGTLGASSFPANQTQWEECDGQLHCGKGFVCTLFGSHRLLCVPDWSDIGTSPVDSIKNSTLTHLSEPGILTAEGLILGFLHRKNLTAEERICMVTAVGDGTYQAYHEYHEMVMLFEHMPHSEAEALSKVARMSQTFTVERLALATRRLMQLMDKFIEHCVHGDTLRLVKKAGEHIGNMSYLGSRLQANGADILKDLADAMQSYDEDALAFGRGMGRMARKVLLSNASDFRLLPEWPEQIPTPLEIANVSEGLLEGFFGSGTELTIISDGDLGNLRIDMHACVVNNREVFESLLLRIGLFSETTEAGKEAPGFLGLLLSEFGELPAVLKRCGIREEQEQMLLDSLFSIGQVHLHLPGHRASPQEAQEPADTIIIHRMGELLKRVAQDWKRLQWLALGRDLGSMLREFVLAGFPELYAVDGQGALRRQLVGLAHAHAASSDGSRSAGVRLSPTATSLAAVAWASFFVGVATATVSAVRVIARRGSSLQTPGSEPRLIQMEDGSATE